MGKSKGPYCGGKLRHRDGTCERDAGAGTDHLGYGRCSWHGGCSPTGSQSAAEQRIEAEAERLLYQHDAPAVTDHLEALQRLAGRVLAMEQFIGEKVNELRSLRYGSEAGGEQLRAEVAVLERAMDRAGRLLVDIAKLNIEERLATVTEQQVTLVRDALAAQLAAAGLPAEQQRDIMTGVGRRLRIVS